MRVRVRVQVLVWGRASAGREGGAGLLGWVRGAHDGEHGLVCEVVAAEPEPLQPCGAARLSQPRGELGDRRVVEQVVAQVELLELREIGWVKPDE